MLRRGITIAGLSSSRLITTRVVTKNLLRKFSALAQPSPPETESIDVRRARLLYQSKKRGILENDIIIGGFAVDHLSKLSAEEVNTYDRIINGDHNEWDLYYYFVGRKEPPLELKDCALFKRMQDYAVNSSAFEASAIDKPAISAGVNSTTVDDSPNCSKKTLLLTVDAKLGKLIPDFMKKNLALIQEMMDVNVELVDKKNGIHLRGLSDVQLHAAKIRLYFRWKSPFNKMEVLGTAVYDDGNYLTVLYRLTTLKTGLSNRYNPINLIMRKKGTFQDIESAKAFSLLKQESEEMFRKWFEEEQDSLKGFKTTNWCDFFKRPKTDSPQDA